MPSIPAGEVSTIRLPWVLRSSGSTALARHRKSALRPTGRRRSCQSASRDIFDGAGARRRNRWRYARSNPACHIRRNAATVASLAAAISACRVTSQRSPTACPPRAAISSATACACTPSSAVTATAAPAPAAASAIPRPSPSDDPVTQNHGINSAQRRHPLCSSASYKSAAVKRPKTTRQIAQKPPKERWSLGIGMLMIQMDFTGVT